MNSIPVRQNYEPFLRLLRARSQIYKEAVRRQVAQFLVTVVIPVIGGIAGLFLAEIRPHVAALAVGLTLLDVAWLDRSQRNKIKIAAKVAERFDCELLEVPWNRFSVGRPADPEIIDSAATAWKGGETGLVDWYPASVGSVPIHLARIVCQRTNLWYDSALRRRYSTILILSALGASLFLFVAGLVGKLSLLDFVLTALTPAAPMLIWALRDLFRQRDAADALEIIKGEAEGLWERALKGDCSDEYCAAASRNFQDAIYWRRVANPLVFPFVYSFLRATMEARMVAGANDLISQLTLERSEGERAEE